MKITKKIKDNVKREKKKKLEINKEFYNNIAVFCVDNDLHIITIYKLLKVKGIEQMLDTMFEETVKEYELHIPTIEKLKDPMIKEQLNKEFKRKGMRCVLR